MALDLDRVRISHSSKINDKVLGPEQNLKPFLFWNFFESTKSWWSREVRWSNNLTFSREWLNGSPIEVADTLQTNLVPRSLVDKAEGEIWPNPICIMWSPVRNVSGEASVHAQHKFGAGKADFVAYNKLTTGLRHDLGIFARISKFHCYHETKQTQNDVRRFFLQLGWICFRILLATGGKF